MKKRVCLLAMLLMLAVMGFAMNVEAAEIVDRGYCGGEGDGKNLTWTLDSDGVLMIEGQGKMKDWTYEEVDPVYRPTDWHKHNEIINSVIVRNGVINIGDFAFGYCSLNSIAMPDTLASIGDSAFVGCSSLSSITLPNTLASIGDYAFSCCSGLSDIALPDTLVSIGDDTFSLCSSLSYITLPDTLVSIGDDTFAHCSSLNSITLPDTLTYIGNGAFADCSSLSSIYLPESLKVIGSWAFNGCENLSSINLPKSLTNIGRGGFANCKSLSSIELPQSLTSVEGYTFGACRNLSNVVLPESLTAIWEFAFASCDKLSIISIPSSIESIDQSAFVDTYLKDIFFGGTKAQWVNINIIPTDENDIRYKVPRDDTDQSYEIYDGLINATVHYEDIDYDKVREFVSRLYRNFLKREPDEGGLADWVDALVSGRGTGAKVVAGFVLSPEYKANSLNNKEFVTALYRIIFNREPDALGLNAWIGVIENGCTIKKVLAGFVNSEEFKNLCRGLGIARGAYYSDEVADQNVKIAAFVARLYNICLERSYEQEGLNYWVNALVDHTMTGSSVVQGFFGSQEFKNRELDDTQFVTTAYRAILNREPDLTGLKSWTDALAKGKTRNYVLNGFLKSEEFDNLCAGYRIVSGNARKAKNLWDILYEGDVYNDSPRYLEGLSDRELKLARNEIYARRGYMFNDPEMAEYFGRKAWYKPSISAKDFDESIFGKSEWKSLQNILSEEEKRANERATLSEKEWLKAEIERFLMSYPASGFLRSTFSEPGSDVILPRIVRHVGEIGVDYDTLLKEMKKEGYIPDWDISYINSENLDELLFRLTGYGLYDKKWNLSYLPYLKSIDTYYTEFSDVDIVILEIEELKSLGNDVYEVKTGPFLAYDGYNNGIIKVRRIEQGGYQFISVQ